MVISDETLAAYAAGALSSRGRRQVERALEADPALAARLLAQHGIRYDASQVGSDHAVVRLTAVEGGARRPVPVVDLAAVRKARQTPEPPRRLRGFAGGLALVTVGLLFGFAADRLLESFSTTPAIGLAADVLVAQGRLDRALTERVSTDPPAQGVRLGQTFRSTDGAVCRLFETMGQRPRAGIACRADRSWRVRMVTEVAASAHLGEVGDDPLVSAAVARMSQVGPMDATAETQARNQGWR